MPNPRFQSFAPALACAPLRRVRYRRLPKPSPVPSPGSDEGRGRPSSPSVGSNPARTPGSSPPSARSESRSFPGTIAFAVRRSGQARSAFRQERVEIEGEPHDLAAPSSRAWHRSELRSFRSPDRRREANSPVSTRSQPRIEANSDPSAAGRRTRSELLVLDPSRRHREASSRPSPPVPPPKRERFEIEPVGCIDRKRTPCLCRQVSRPEQAPNLDPSQPRTGASSVLDRRTAWEPKSPHDPLREPSGSNRSSNLRTAGPEPGT